MRVIRSVAVAIALAAFVPSAFAQEAGGEAAGAGGPAKPVILNPQAQSTETQEDKALEANARKAKADAAEETATETSSPERAREEAASKAPVKNDDAAEVESARSAASELGANTAGAGGTAPGDKSEAAAEDAAMAEAAEISKAEEQKSKPQAPVEPTLTIDIDLTKQRMTVSETGTKKHSWSISSGRYGYRTPTGSFKPVWMTKMWYSRQYDYAPMPHSIFFHGGTAIHATYATGMLGRPASHGCVRLAPSNAAALYKLVSKHGKERTRIVVHGTPNFDAEVAARGQQRYSRRYAYRDGTYYGQMYSNYRNRYGYGYDGYYETRRRYYPTPRRYVQQRGLLGGGGGYYGYGYGY